MTDHGNNKTPQKTLFPESQGVSIVARGHFNPAIFHPIWFSTNNLVRPEEAETAEIQIVDKDVTSCRTEWFSLQVLNDRFAVDTANPTMHQLLRDLVHGTFQILEHTPIRAFGFNRYQLLRLDAPAERLAFSGHYVPMEPWRGLFADSAMRGVVVEGRREDSQSSRIQVRIEPSPNADLGFHVHLNEHYDIPQDFAPPEAMGFFLATLRDSWNDFLAYWTKVAEHLMTEYKR